MSPRNRAISPRSEGNNSLEDLVMKPDDKSSNIVHLRDVQVLPQPKRRLSWWRMDVSHQIVQTEGKKVATKPATSTGKPTTKSGSNNFRLNNPKPVTRSANQPRSIRVTVTPSVSKPRKPRTTSSRKPANRSAKQPLPQPTAVEEKDEQSFHTSTKLITGAIVIIPALLGEFIGVGIWSTVTQHAWTTSTWAWIAFTVLGLTTAAYIGLALASRESKGKNT